MITIKEQQAIEKRKQTILHAIIRVKIDIEYEITHHDLTVALKKIKSQISDYKYGARMTEHERNILGSGAYGFNYKFQELKEWEDNQWNNLIVNKTNEAIEMFNKINNNI